MDTWSPCSFDIYELTKALPEVNVISAEIQDYKYNYSIQRVGRETKNSQMIRNKQYELLNQLGRKQLLSLQLLDELNVFFAGLGATVDQNLGSALAQIQIIAQKQS